MIDESTFEKFEAARETAQRTGYSLAEVLDARDLLLTPKRRMTLESRVLEDLLRRLERQSPGKIMAWHRQRPEGTSAEMFAAMLEWVEAVVRAHAKGTLEDL